MVRAFESEDNERSSFFFVPKVELCRSACAATPPPTPPLKHSRSDGVNTRRHLTVQRIFPPCFPARPYDTY